MTYKTEQESFWAGEFGNEYIERNKSNNLLISNFAMFSRILKSATKIKSIVEFGCNIGLNLEALAKIDKNFDLCGYEINEQAANKAKSLGVADIITCSILEPISVEKKYDLAFTKGVLIHINPSELEKVYQNLYNISNKYILIVEYYSPNQTMIEYRGNSDKLDFLHK